MSARYEINSVPQNPPLYFPLKRPFSPVNRKKYAEQAIVPYYIYKSLFYSAPFFTFAMSRVRFRHYIFFDESVFAFIPFGNLENFIVQG